jgi:hypothetical protein
VKKETKSDYVIVGTDSNLVNNIPQLKKKVTKNVNKLANPHLFFLGVDSLKEITN